MTYLKTFVLTLVLLSYLPQWSFAQHYLSWESLEEIEYIDVFMKDLDDTFQKPIFSAEMEQLHGEVVVLTGYLLPLDVEGDFYILSKYPYNACFFCGSGDAGPASVIELELKKKETWFQMDDILTFKGVLQLNDADPERMYYIFKNAEVTSP